MSWGQEYADRDHWHREIDEERYDRERAIDEGERNLFSLIDAIRTDCNAAREELWAEIHELRTQLTTLAAKVSELHDQLQNARS
jgi:hypothetical protein